MKHGINEKRKPCWSPCACVGCTPTVGCWRSAAPGTPLHPSGPLAPPQPGGSGRTYCHLGLAASCNRHPEQRHKFSCRFVMLCVTFACTAKIYVFSKIPNAFFFLNAKCIFALYCLCELLSQWIFPLPDKIKLIFFRQAKKRKEKMS